MFINREVLKTENKTTTTKHTLTSTRRQGRALSGSSQLRATVASTEDLGSVSSAHGQVRPSATPVPGTLLTSGGTRPVHGTHSHMQAKISK